MSNIRIKTKRWPCPECGADITDKMNSADHRGKSTVTCFKCETTMKLGKVTEPSATVNEKPRERVRVKCNADETISVGPHDLISLDRLMRHYGKDAVIDAMNKLELWGARTAITRANDAQCAKDKNKGA